MTSSGWRSPAITGGAAAGRADRHEDLTGEAGGQPLKGLGQPHVRGGAGRVQGGAFDAAGDGERWEQAVAPCDGIQQRQDAASMTTGSAPCPLRSHSASHVVAAIHVGIVLGTRNRTGC
jgi:hypothetical protein